MTKQELLENPASCLNKAADDEPLFVLRSQDRSSVKHVVGWALEHYERAGPTEKAADALKDAAAMIRWQMTHTCKWPD